MKLITVLISLLLAVSCETMPTGPGAVSGDNTLAKPITASVVKPVEKSAPLVATLKQGSKGPAVGAVQTQLIKLCYLKGTADQDFGPKTHAAAVAFQKDNGIVASGLVGPKTQEVLKTAKGICAAPAEPQAQTPSSLNTLSWDNKPERKEWTKQVLSQIDKDWATYSKVTDGNRLCTKYNTLTKEQKTQVLAEFMAQVAYHESGWEPTKRFYEKTMGYYSEGLLMLSYADDEWLKCGIDEGKDKSLAPTDPKRTILQPAVNLDCGMKVLAMQVEKYKKLIIRQGVYWAVIHDGGRYNKIKDIVAKTNALPYCR